MFERLFEQNIGICRLYGREKVAACVDAIMRRPEKALPVLLQRMKNKDLEWREARRGFLKTWREQNEKYHYKAMDHQGINFKQIDSKKLRSKALLSEIETRYDTRNEEAEKAGREPGVGPHMQLSYCDAHTLDDAATLLLHHAKRQTAAAPHKEDRRKMRRVVEHFLPQLFFREQPTSGGWSLEDSDARDDDEHSGENGTEDVKDVPKSVIGTDLTSEKVVAGLEIIGGKNGTSLRAQRPLIARLENAMSTKPQPVGPVINEVRSCVSADEYRLFMCNNYWYLFLRLHHMLCERLKYVYREASKRAEEAEAERIRGHKNEPAAEMLGMRPKREIDVEDYYVAFLDMVKSLLDGTMETNAFEETLREMFSTRAYLVFTIDKIVVNAVRQLTHIVTDRTSQELMRIFETERKRGNVGGLNAHLLSPSPNDHPYQKHVEGVLADQNCFKFITTKDALKMSIELIDTDTVEWEEEEEEKEEKTMQVERWEDYVDKYLEETHPAVPTVELSSTDALEAGKDKPVSEGPQRTVLKELRRLLCKKPLFLPRNARGGRMRNCNKRMTRFDEANVAPAASCTLSSSSVSPADRDESEPSPVKKPRRDNGEFMFDEVNHKVGDDVGTGKRTMKYLLYRPRSLQRAREYSSDSIDFLTQKRLIFLLFETSIREKLRDLAFEFQLEIRCSCEIRDVQTELVHQSVSERLNGKFRSWHKEWSKEKVPEEQQRLCSDWLLGKLDGVRPHRTKVLTLNENQRPPYSPYNRYKVDWPSPSPPTPS
ncbi:unnamed protein product [Notodromas monacha]|uniref:Sin3 C-terminal domain-containing protein n=1 Tax=Notodromas monacha TaxID=399045 RepID=A0A7R9BJ71_9CRUS|nr:unnamed protein product [Notodromas monacha]CAG0915393.1 unnamed protein product [Notodromas monacha]